MIDTLALPVPCEKKTIRKWKAAFFVGALHFVGQRL